MTTGRATEADVDRRFLDRLRAALPDPPSPEFRYAVAFSGGLDSTVLLAALVRIGARAFVRALHVDHRLQPESAAWPLHCERVSMGLGVPLGVLRVDVDRRSGLGIEAAARRARYAALAGALRPAETLLTAHHADDQLETLLLRLVRGTGVRGMRGILPVARLGGRRVARPMLGFTRAELAAAAERWNLDWIEDPSNRSLDFDRNLIRSRLAPVLRERWGDTAAKRAARLADAMRDAEAILAEVARQDLDAAGADRGRVPLAGIRSLDAARQRNLLRRAIRDANVPMPDASRLEALRRAIGASREDAVRRIEWRGAEARIHRDRLYLRARTPGVRGDADDRGGGERGTAGAGDERGAVRPDAMRPRMGRVHADGAMRVSATEPWQGPEGRVVLEPAAEPASIGLPESWARAGLEVRFRRGGERFKPAGARHRRTLKAWLREQGVVPWMRDKIPLLYRDAQLVAIADLAIDDAACRAEPDEPRWRVRWLDHPRID